jgi:heptaprenyl diphosphate synthase
MKTKRITLLALCASVALLMSYVEFLIPPIFSAVPGIKMGLPNIAILIVLYHFGTRDAIVVSLVRLVITTFLFGNFTTFIYSLAGAVLSLLVMVILKKINLLSTVGVSVAGAVMHNLGQIVVAMALMHTSEIGYYMIVLAITGTISGIFIGLCGSLVLKRISNIKM